MISVPYSLTGHDLERYPEIAMRHLFEPTNRPALPLRRPAAALLLLACVVIATSFTASPVAADFRLCNNTNSRIGVALGYEDNDGWATEGWWNLPARNCDTLLRGSLAARFYYIYAVDYDHGGEWSGQAFMCTREKEFTIRGTGDCLARGYDRTGFFEVDTGEQQTWTVQLTEASEGQRPAPAGQAPLTAPPAGSRSGPAPPAGTGK
jgi:uncharacterized membrane protein